MIARPTRQDWLLLFVLGVMWGTSYVFIKIAIESLSTFTLIAVRLGIGLALLATVVAVRRVPLPREPRIYGHLLVMSVINIVIPFTLITTAEQQVDSNIAAIINGAVPLFVVVIAAFALHDEPLTINRLAGISIGYIGVVVLVSRGLLEGGTTASLSGELMLVGSTLAYAVGAVYSRAKMRGVPPLVPALFQVAFAFVLVSIVAVATEHPLAQAWTTDALFAIAWLGIFGSGIAYILNFRLLSRIGAGGTSVLAYLLPIVGIVSGFALRREAVDASLLVGTALILGGIGLTTRKWGQRTIFGQSRQASTATSGAAAVAEATSATAPGAPPRPR